MALSYVTYTANGSTNQFDITFSYIDSSHVKVYVNGVQDTSFTFVNTSRIQTSTTPANGIVVKIDRDTPTTSRLVDFQDGSTLTESDLDKSANQNFYTVQENADAIGDCLKLNNSNLFDADNKRIINVANPTSNQDAATKHYLENTWLSTTDKTNLTAVAAKTTELGRLGTADAVADMAILGTTDVVADLNTLATSAIVEDLNILGTSDVVADMNTLATSAVVADLDAVADKVTEIGRLGTSDAVADLALLGTSAIVTDMDLLATSGNITAMGLLGNSTTVTNMGLLGVSGVITDMNLIGTSAVVADLDAVADKVTEIGRLGTADAVADLAILGTSAIVADMAILGTSDVVADMNTLATSDVVADMNTLATSDIVSDMNTLATSANVTAMGLLGNSTTVTNMGLLGTSAVITDMGLLGTSDCVADMALLATSDIISDMNTLATSDIIADLNTLATSDIVTDMNLLATSANVTAMGLLGVSGVITDMGLLGTSAVVTDMDLLGTSANVTNMATLGASGVVANIATTAGSISNVNLVGGSISNVNSVATNMASVNSFANTYRIASSAPSTSLDVGDLYFDTSADELKVYKSGGWAAAGSTVNGTSQRYKYVATSNQTTFTGADSGSNTLAYDSGFTDVYLNGVHLDTTDYTATSGTSVVLGSGAATGDILYIVAFGTFAVAAINADNLNSGTVPSARIASGSIANDLIDSQHYAAGSIDLEHLASQSVDEDNLYISNAGSNGQFLSKQSGNAGGLTWATVDTTIADDSIVEAKLDVSNAPSNGKFLQAQSGEGGGLTWADANQYTHPNHSGEVISSADGAQTITDNIVDEANLKVSNAPTNGQFLQAQSGNTGGLTWAVPTDTNTTYSVQDGELSQNNFTNADHSKLDGIASSANNYTHPNHSGEVTSTADGATVVADNIIDEANLKVSNSPTNDYVLTAQSGNTGGLTWAAAGVGVPSSSTAIGSIGLVRYWGTWANNATTSHTNLSFKNASGTGSGSCDAGTWRNTGGSTSNTSNAAAVTTAQRIS